MGSVVNRIRFAVEAPAMAAVGGADRVGFRICPGNPFNDLSTGPGRNLPCVPRHRPDRVRLLPWSAELDPDDAGHRQRRLANEAFGGLLIANDSYDLAEAKQTVEAGTAEAISFARAYIGNPDLVERFAAGAELARFNPKQLYSKGPEGYSDYPPLG